MTKDKLASIKRLTTHTYLEIMEMDNMVFWKEITMLVSRGRLNAVQYEYFIKERKKYKLNGIDKDLLDILEVSGGKIIKE